MGSLSPILAKAVAFFPLPCLGPAFLCFSFAFGLNASASFSMASARLPSRMMVARLTPCLVAMAVAVSIKVSLCDFDLWSPPCAFFVLLYRLPRIKLRWSGVRLRRPSWFASIQSSATDALALFDDRLFLIGVFVEKVRRLAGTFHRGRTDAVFSGEFGGLVNRSIILTLRTILFQIGFSIPLRPVVPSSKHVLPLIPCEIAPSKLVRFDPVECNGCACAF